MKKSAMLLLVIIAFIIFLLIGTIGGAGLKYTLLTWGGYGLLTWICFLLNEKYNAWL